MLHNIRRTRPLLTQALVQALVILHLDYCNSILAGLPASDIRPLQLIQNAAAWQFFDLNSLTLLHSLHLPSPPLATSGCLHPFQNTSTCIIKDKVKRYTPARSLRTASANQLAAPSLLANPSTKSPQFADLAP